MPAGTTEQKTTSWRDDDTSQVEEYPQSRATILYAE
jgi:hypothetical protein